jgi:hypothetical protein
MKRIAVIGSIYRYLSHVQHIADRFLVGYPFRGQWHRPDMKIVSLYVDQKPEGDQSEARAKEFGFTVYPTIAEALRCGTDKLAVDAVLLIVEHGNYARNEKGQVLYPRYEFFKECADVFEKDGRSVPVYNDKHLSWSFDKAKSMVDTAKRLRFPLLAGSSLPVTWRLPDVELPLGCHIEEALMIGVGGSDPMDYHALEAMQCMIERRRGGETGVRAVQMIEGGSVWKAGADGRWSKDLLVSALSRSDTPQGHTVTDGRTQDLVGTGELQRLVKNPCRVLHRAQGRSENHAPHAERRRSGLQLRRANSGRRREVVPVLPLARTERDVLGVSRQQGRGDVRDRPRAVSQRSERSSSAASSKAASPRSKRGASVWRRHIWMFATKRQSRASTRRLDAH